MDKSRGHRQAPQIYQEPSADHRTAVQYEPFNGSSGRQEDRSQQVKIHRSDIIDRWLASPSDSRRHEPVRREKSLMDRTISNAVSNRGKETSVRRHEPTSSSESSRYPSPHTPSDSSYLRSPTHDDRHAKKPAHANEYAPRYPEQHHPSERVGTLRPVEFMEVDYSSESDDENTPVARIDYQPVPPHCVPTPVPPVPPAPKMSRTMTRQPSLSATTRMVPVYNPASHEPQMYIPTPASPTSPEMYRERERNAAVTLSSMSARGSISSMRSTSPGPSPVRARQESVPMPSPTTSRFPTARTGVPPPSMNPNISMDSGRHLTTRSFEGDESMAGLKAEYERRKSASSSSPSKPTKRRGPYFCLWKHCTCPEKPFYEIRDRNRHMDTHFGNRYVCPICMVHLSRREGVRRHHAEGGGRECWEELQRRGMQDDCIVLESVWNKGPWRTDLKTPPEGDPLRPLALKNGNYYDKRAYGRHDRDEMMSDADY